MPAHPERNGEVWIIRDDIPHDGRAVPSWWDGSGWMQAKEKAETFPNETTAAARVAELPPAETKQVASKATMCIGWDDSHSLSALLSRAEELIARGRFEDATQVQSLIQSVRSGDPHRDELAQRLRDLCDLAEAASLAEGAFLHIMRSPPAARSALLRGMVGSRPPTYEEEWIEFKSALHGPAGKQAPMNDEQIKSVWSESLSGFANTGGGVLIWGIEASKCPSASDPTKKIDAASGLRLVPHPESLKSDLLRLHHVATDPPVVGVRIEHVTEPDGRGFVVCFVPESEHKPHRAEFCKNKPYYIRTGDDFVVMPPSVLRSMFFPRAIPRYAVRIRCRGRNLHNATIAKIDITVIIHNTGNATASEPFIVLRTRAWGNTAPSVHAHLGWSHLHVEDGIGLVSRASIHPGATAPTIGVEFPKMDTAPDGRIVIDCTIHSLNAPPKHFSTTFDLADVLAGKDLTNNAAEITRS